MSVLPKIPGLHRTACAYCGGTGWVPDFGNAGCKLRVARKKAGIGLREMAGRLEISSGYLHDLEHGRRRWSPKLIEHYRIALAL